MPRRLITLLRWPFGITLTAWRYLWRVTPVHRRELPGSWAEDAPPSIAAGVAHTAIQTPEDGAGPLLHRRYAIRLAGARLTPEALMERLGADPNRVAPGSLARFDKTAGEPGRMAVGDEWLVKMPGPWDGPVRVVESTPRSFRFATLDGHLEAGQIEWSADRTDGDLCFAIESWARAGDRLSHLMHNRLRMAKEVQLHMWTSVCEQVARFAGGTPVRGVEVETRVAAD